MNRPQQICYGILVLFLSSLSGCSWFNDMTMRSQSPEESPAVEHKVKLIGDITRPFGLYPVRVEAVALVTGLNGTGSDPAPSGWRDALLEEMQTRNVEKPSAILASPDTALVLVQGILRPGIQKGDSFDVEVRVPGQSESRSLRGGYLLETRLRELAVLNNRVHSGKVLALAQGPILVDPSADAKKDRVLACRGRILGGGVALKSRSLGLVLEPESQSVVLSARIEKAVNRRFHTFRNGLKAGVAKAKTEEYVQLSVHPRYRDNIARYLQVVSSLPITESASEKMERIEDLQRELFEPSTAAGAALQLEALGKDGEPVLLKGLKSKDDEVRFYAAEALAYLDRREAAPVLGEAAKEHPAFRVYALTALSSMQDFAASEQLQDMLSSPSAETRYGAFRALWTMNKNDPLVAGEKLGGEFNYHLLDVSGPPMIHVTHNRLPEIVLFGSNQKFLTPLSLNAGNQIMVNSTPSGEIAVSKFVVKEADQKRTVSPSVDEVIRAVVELGGTYPDVVQMLQEAKKANTLGSRFEVDALPQPARRYVSNEDQQDQNDDSVKKNSKTSVPDLFYKKAGKDTPDDGFDSTNTSKNDSDKENISEKNPAKKNLLGKMFGVASKG
ncbi:MAG: flagellar basal body P-ring protein FlgI [Thermoguttaceae bacterium]